MRRVGAVALLGLVLGACRLQIDVVVPVADDGTGWVEVVVGVDRDGIERIGGDLSDALVVDDIEAAGWRVEGPDEDAEGITRVRFRKPFDDVAEANAIFGEIAGADGPFQDLTLTQGSSFATTEWDFTGRIDFAGGIDAFGDAALAAELDGQPIGQTVKEIEAQLGEPLSEVIEVGVAVGLPGEVTSNASAATEDGVRWHAGFGTATVDMEATGNDTRTATVIGITVALASAVLLLAYWLVRRSLRASGD